ncbi:MAG: tetratricopeptide repeat protein [Chryseolinea sp.]
MRLVFVFFALVASVSVLGQVIPDNNEILKEVDGIINSYQFEKALAVLEQSPDTFNTEIIQRKGYCHSRLGNYQQAIDAYETVVKTDSTNTGAFNQLGQLYSRTGEYDLAKELYQKLMAADTANSFYYKQYASLLVQTGEGVYAIPYYLKTVEMNPHDLEAYSSLANLLFDIEAYDMADSILMNALKTIRHPQLKLLLAKAQLGEKKYKSVINNVNELLLYSDTTVTSARLLGISYFQLDKHDEAISCMKYLVGSGAEADWIYYYIGASYQQLNNPDSAIAYLNKAIEAGISNNIGTYYTQLAISYENTGDFKNAIHYYKAAYENSKSDILLYHLARNYDQFYKDKSSAIAYYKKYLSSDDTIKVTREYSQQRMQQLTDFR